MADAAGGGTGRAMSDVVSRLALDRFRSWSRTVVDFEPGVNVLYGRNGIGKTNLVEALEFLSVGSSPRTSAAKYLVQHGQTNAVIRANAAETRDGCARGSAGPGADSVWAHTLQVTIPVRGAVRSRVDSGPSKYFRDIAGMVRVVAFGPQDQQLASGDPAGRRRFLDQSATLMFPEYYAALQRFRQIARQRAAVADRFNGLFARTYVGFAGGGRADARLEYRPSFAEALESGPAEAKQRIAQHFQRIYPGEVSRETNLIGPQRDEMLVVLDGEPAREFASNGELWTIGLAMRLAQFQYLSGNVPRETTSMGALAGTAGALVSGAPARPAGSARNDARPAENNHPILVLDDVFAQLDESRRERILDFAGRQGQVFLTAAAKGDVPSGSGWHGIDVEKYAERQHGVL